MNNKDEVSRRSRGYEERIVAFVDILGFSSLVEKSNTDQRVYEQIKHALDTIQEIKKRSDGTNTKAATFSDSIVLSYSITAERAEKSCGITIRTVKTRYSCSRWGCKGPGQACSGNGIWSRDGCSI